MCWLKACTCGTELAAQTLQDCCDCPCRPMLPACQGLPLLAKGWLPMVGSDVPRYRGPLHGTTMCHTQHALHCTIHKTCSADLHFTLTHLLLPRASPPLFRLASRCQLPLSAQLSLVPFLLIRTVSVSICNSKALEAVGAVHCTSSNGCVANTTCRTAWAWRGQGSRATLCQAGASYAHLSLLAWLPCMDSSAVLRADKGQTSHCCS